MKKIKIGYLITGLDFGGAEMQLFRIISNLDKTKFDPFVISMMDKGQIGENMLNAGIPVYELGMKRNVPQYKAVIKLYKLLKDEKPKILNSFLFHANLLGRILGKLSRTPIVISSIRNINFGGKKREKLIKSTNFLVDFTVINSKIAGERMIKDKIIPERKLKVIVNGIDTKSYSISDYKIREKLKIELGIEKNKFIWIAVGRFDHQKNYTTLIKSFSKVIEFNPNCKLIIAGDGPLRQSCEELVKMLNIEEKVLFLGIRKDIPQLLSIADGYVMSSLWEGMPNVIMEAASSGIPVVSTNVGGVSELVIDSKTGMLVHDGNEISITKKMLEMMFLLEKERKEMGSNGKRHMIDNYDIKVIVKQWEELYNELLKEKNIK